MLKGIFRTSILILAVLGVTACGADHVLPKPVLDSSKTLQGKQTAVFAGAKNEVQNLFLPVRDLVHGGSFEEEQSFSMLTEQFSES